MRKNLDKGEPRPATARGNDTIRLTPQGRAFLDELDLRAEHLEDLEELADEVSRVTS
jgi:hypothetical protein